MKISVAELMRIKNRISGKINKLSLHLEASGYRHVPLSFGMTLESNQIVSEDQALKADEFINMLDQLLELNKKVCDALSAFNSDNKITDLIREKQNLVLLNKAIEEVMSKSIPVKKTKFEVVGEERISIPVEFRPYCNLDALRSRLVANKNRISQIQIEVDKHNGSILEIDMDLETIQGLGV